MQFRNRVKELRQVKVKELKANPKNWRIHNQTQSKLMKEVLGNVGFAAAVIARETDTGELEIIDGHLRKEIFDENPDTEIPVLVLDVSQEEADYILMTFDPVSQLAYGDKELYDKLRQDSIFDLSGITEILDDVNASSLLGYDNYSKILEKRKTAYDVVAEKYATLNVDKIQIPLTDNEHKLLLKVIDLYVDKYLSLVGFFNAFFCTFGFDGLDLDEVRPVVEETNNQYLLEKLNREAAKRVDVAE